MLSIARSAEGHSRFSKRLPSLHYLDFLKSCKCARNATHARTHTQTKALLTQFGRSYTCMINEALETGGIFDVSLSGAEGETQVTSIQPLGVWLYFLLAEFAGGDARGPRCSKHTQVLPLTDFTVTPPFCGVNPEKISTSLSLNNA